MCKIKLDYDYSQFFEEVYLAFKCHVWVCIGNKSIFKCVGVNKWRSEENINFFLYCGFVCLTALRVGLHWNRSLSLPFQKVRLFCHQAPEVHVFPPHNVTGMCIYAWFFTYALEIWTLVLMLHSKCFYPLTVSLKKKIYIFFLRQRFSAYPRLS